MHNATYSAQWVQSKPVTNGKLYIFIFPHTLIYIISNTSSERNTAKFFVITILSSGVVWYVSCESAYSLFERFACLTHEKNTGILAIRGTDVSFTVLLINQKLFFAAFIASKFLASKKLLNNGIRHKNVLNDISLHVVVSQT